MMIDSNALRKVIERRLTQVTLNQTHDFLSAEDDAVMRGLARAYRVVLLDIGTAENAEEEKADARRRQVDDIACDVEAALSSFIGRTRL